MISQQEHPDWSARIVQLRAEEKRRTERALAASRSKGYVIPSVPGDTDNKPAPRRLDPYTIIDIVSAGADDPIVVTDVGQHQMWTAQRYPLKRPRSFLSSGGLGTMGFGVGAAIGAHAATGKRIVLFTGDGGFGMSLNELATAVTQHTPVVIIIMNNGVLGMVRQLQTMFYDRHYSNTTLNRRTNFVRLAEAFGAAGAQCTTAEELEKAVKDAFGYNGPFVIDCAVDCDEFVLPMLPPGGSIDEIITEID
jgi:acetolactate synthase-1/2/3 large subunit